MAYWSRLAVKRTVSMNGCVYVASCVDVDVLCGLDTVANKPRVDDWNGLSCFSAIILGVNPWR